MMRRNASKSGFTLIELVVTMAITGIFCTLAFNLYSTANRAFITDRANHNTFFTYNVKSAQTEKILRDHPGMCEKKEFADEAFYTFTGDSSLILNESLPFKPLRCRALDKKRNLVYFHGYLDSASRALASFSTIVDK